VEIISGLHRGLFDFQAAWKINHLAKFSKVRKVTMKKSQLSHLIDEIDGSPDGLETLLEKLRAATQSTHTDEHPFVKDTKYPAFCAVCGWINPSARDNLLCKHTVKDHALQTIQQIEALKLDLRKIGVLLVVEIRIDIPLSSIWGLDQ
jgi:hypothetical protein